VEAAVALHAKQGALATGHALIAEHAGVSVPTVYKYFPTRNDLIPACTGLVASRAPLVLDGRIFDGLTRVADRVRALARALFRLHEYFAPWLRWVDSDAAALPALQDFLEQGRKGRLELLRLALTVPGSRPPGEQRILLGHVLLEYPSWKVLTTAGKSSDEAAAVVADAVLDLVRSRSH
jgi:AcrR family transcriptional regulator